MTGNSAKTTGQMLIRARYSGTVPARRCKGGKAMTWKPTAERPESARAVPMSASWKPARMQRGHESDLYAVRERGARRGRTEAADRDGRVAEEDEEGLQKGRRASACARRAQEREREARTSSATVSRASIDCAQRDQVSKCSRSSRRASERATHVGDERRAHPPREQLPEPRRTPRTPRRRALLCARTRARSRARTSSRSARLARRRRVPAVRPVVGSLLEAALLLARRGERRRRRGDEAPVARGALAAGAVEVVACARARCGGR